MSIKNCKKCNSIKEISKSGIIFCRNCKNSNSRKYHELNKINGKKRINKQIKNLKKQLNKL